MCTIRTETHGFPLSRWFYGLAVSLALMFASFLYTGIYVEQHNLTVPVSMYDFTKDADKLYVTFLLSFARTWVELLLPRFP